MWSKSVIQLLQINRPELKSCEVHAAVDDLGKEKKHYKLEHREVKGENICTNYPYWFDSKLWFYIHTY